MPLTYDYLVEGTITLDSVANVGASIIVYNITEKTGTVTTTSIGGGSYSVNVRTIVTDGDEILVIAETTTGIINARSGSITSPTSTISVDIIDYTTLDLISSTYESKLRYCTMDDVNRQFTNNIDVINFWSDDITAVHKGKNSEPVSFYGVEYPSIASDPSYIAYKFEQIWHMQDDNEEITIDSVDDCIDGVYVIKDFSIQSVKKVCNAYTWRLNLEYVRDVS